MNKRIVVFSPHPDDETLGCGGTISKKIHEGYEVILVVLTDGRHALSALFGITSNPTPEEMMQIRKNELINVAKILGVPHENLLHLSFEDGTVEQNKQEIAQIVLEILSKSEPQEIYFPYEQDFHRDHQITSQIVKSCVRKLGISASTYQYSIMQKNSRVAPLMARLLNPLRRNLFFVDVSQFVQQKAKALNEYKSQTTIFSKEQNQAVVPNIQKFLKKKEMFYIH